MVLSCIDSRTPAELIFDLGLGDIFSVRMAGNVTSPKVLGSMEYGCCRRRGQTDSGDGPHPLRRGNGGGRSGMLASVVEEATGCQNLASLVKDIQRSIDLDTCRQFQHAAADDIAAYADEVARRNVLNSVQQILEQSSTIRHLVQSRKIAVVGAMYDVNTGAIDYLSDATVGLVPASERETAIA